MKLKPKELRELSDAELARRLDEAYEELFNLRTRLAIRELDNFAEIPKTKKTIARIKTIMRERQFARGEV